MISREQVLERLDETGIRREEETATPISGQVCHSPI